MKPRNVQLICSEERAKEIFSTSKPFARFERSDFQILYYDVPGLEGVELPNPFPEADSFYMGVYQEALDYINRFPKCCSWHKQLVGKTWFNKGDYEELPMKAARQLYYTTVYLEDRVQDDNWYKDITDYIELNVYSFGQLPDGYGSPVGLHYYTLGIQKWFEMGNSALPENLQNQIKSYLANRNKEVHKADINLNLLYDIYQKWLAIFPFDIEYFREKKAYLSKTFPLFAEKMDYNRFMGTYSGKPQTPDSLVNSLVNMTTHLFKMVKSKELVENGVIEDVVKHKVDLINETHRLKQTALLETFSPNEKRYVDLLKEWLQNEKEYFTDIAPYLNVNIERERTKVEKLREAFTSFGFCELPLVKQLSNTQLNSLFTLISENKLPYQIAMLSYLGFLEYLLKQHIKSSYELHKHLAQWLNAEKNIRAIKGNINILSSASKDSKSKFTAHLHKETVKKDYQNLK